MVTRVNAVDYLVGNFGSGTRSLLSLASVDLTDTLGGLKEPIDQALMLIGVAFGDLADSVGDDQAPVYFAALKYTGLRRILAGLNANTQMDVGAGQGITLKGSQLVEKVWKLLGEAQAELSALGVEVATEPGSAWAGITNYNLDYLEPLEATV